MTEEIKFEKALERLEKIVDELESGNIALEDALKKYEEGVKLSSICQKKLSNAEKKVEVLTRALDGSLKKEPFDTEEMVEEETPTKTKKKMSKETVSDDDEDLLL